MDDYDLNGNASHKAESKIVKADSNSPRRVDLEKDQRKGVCSGTGPEKDSIRRKSSSLEISDDEDEQQPVQANLNKIGTETGASVKTGPSQDRAHTTAVSRNGPKTDKTPPKPNRGRVEGPESSGQKCKYCVNRYSDSNHHIKDCNRAPHCKKCHFNGHDASACGARNIQEKFCAKCHSRNDDCMAQENTHSDTRDNRAISELSKKEKKARRKKMKEQKKRQQQVELSTYEGLNSEQAVAKAPIITSTPNSCNSKVGESDPLLISPKHDENDNDVIIDVEEEEEESKEEIVEIPTKPKEHPETIDHFWNKDKDLLLIHLPTQDQWLKAFTLSFIETWFFLFLSLLDVNFFFITFLKSLSLLLTLYQLYNILSTKRKLVLHMRSTFMDDNDQDDYRTDVQKISDLKHKKPINYRATFEWHTVNPGACFSTTKPLNKLYIIDPDGNLTPLQTALKFLGYSMIPSPPVPMKYSAEAASQFMGPNIFDLNSSADETSTRINFSLRNLGTISADRFLTLNHDSNLRDAAIASVIMQHDERWRKNALTLN